jgi:hypothetical protein
MTPHLLLALALLAPAGPVIAAEPTTAPAPTIQVRESTQDGGTVEEGTVVKYRFVVTNPGKSDLEITQVKPSCGCTVPKWDKVIAPEKEGVIEAEVKTLGFRGSILKHLTVISNDPAHPQLELSLTAKVTPLVEVTPGVVALVTVEDQPIRQVFTLERTGGQAMKIEQVVANQPYLKTELTPVSGQGRYELAVTVTPEVPWGRTVIPVVVRTDIEKAPNQTLTLIVDRGIVTTPPTVYLQAAPGPLTTPQQAILLIMRPKGPFHVKEVKVDDPKLQAKVEPVQDGQQYRVTVSYTGGWDAGSVERMLTVATDDPKQPEIKVPIHTFLQNAPPAH